MVTKSTTPLGGNISAEKHTADIFRAIADDICSMIKFTVDLPENHPDKWLPVLDLKVRLENTGKIQHQFYEKETKNPLVILADSALSWRQKRTILTQEALRRLRNTSIDLGEEAQNLHLTNFMLKLKASGYSEKFRAEIVSSSKSAYRKMLDQDEKGIRKLYRSRDEMLAHKAQKNKGTLWWNKNTGTQKKATSILFVPPTPNGELMKMLSEREKELNKNSKMSIKILEKGGRKFKDFLTKANPFKSSKCSEEKCPLCRNTLHTRMNSKNKFSCDTPNVGYNFKCTNCQATYEGETARIARMRAIEHVNDLNL